MVVGQTKDAGFQIGVSKTVPVSCERVWEVVTSPAGVGVWLGAGASLRPGKGEPYRTADGATGEVRSFHIGRRIRLTCRPAGWDHDTIIQVTVTPTIGGRTVLRFHQERLADAAERSRQYDHWQSVMAEIVDALGSVEFAARSEAGGSRPLAARSAGNDGVVESRTV